MKNDSNLKAALEYASNGFRVFPLVEGKKRPLTSNGLHAATTDEHQIRLWWDKHPNAGIGIATGHLDDNTSFFALDIDMKDGVDGLNTLSNLQSKNGTLPLTLEVDTPSGGKHLFFFSAGIEIRNSQGHIGEGLDIRGEGGYVVAPPTELPNGSYISKHKFEVAQIANSPGWLVELLRKPKPVTNDFTTPYHLDLPSPDQEMADLLLRRAIALAKGDSGRNDVGFWLACQLRDNGFDKKWTQSVMLEYASVVKSYKDHEYEVDEALSSVEQAFSRESREPWRPSFKLTDLGNAERLVFYFGEEIRYCPQWKKWLIWDGTRWKIDESNAIVQKAKDTVRKIYGEAEQQVDSAKRSELVGHATRSEYANRINAMISLAASDQYLVVTPDELDSDHLLFNVENGTVDLRTGDLLPHNKRDLITKKASVVYDKSAKALQFEQFVSQIMNEDEEMVAFLQKLVGYGMSGLVSEQYLFFEYGSGANGKSTFDETIVSIFDEYAQKAPSEMLMSRRPGGVPNDIARLKGARLVVTSEIEAGRQLSEPVVKDLTGGDTLVARFMHGEFFEFKPTHKLLMYGNSKPMIKGTDNGIWRRILTIPFEVTIPEDKRDPKLKEKLLKEKSGILNWMIQGFLNWNKNGLNPPDKVLLATAKYRNESDSIQSFIEESCTIIPNAKVRASKLLEAYRKWCLENGEEVSTAKQFKHSLQEKGFNPHRKKDGMWWKGIGLREEDESVKSAFANDRSPIPSNNHVSSLPHGIV